MVSTLQETGADIICLLPPGYKDAFDITAELIAATKKAGIPNVCLILSAGRGFYAEHLLQYSWQAQEEGKLPLPIGTSHKFAHMASSDVAEVVAHMLTGHGKHGFSNKYCGQLMVLTGPQLTAGHELATAASQALGKELKFKDISESEAKKVFKDDAGSPEGKIAYLLEYYALVREGKINYILTTAFHDMTRNYLVEPTEFFKQYAEELRPKPNKKRKTQ